jgi:hypothetical protein
MNQIVQDSSTGVEALARLFLDEQLGKTHSARDRLELVLDFTNQRIGGFDLGLQMAIRFQERPCGSGLRSEFEDTWLYEKFKWANPANANQIGHFLIAVRLGYDPSFVGPRGGTPIARIDEVDLSLGSGNAFHLYLGAPSDEPFDVTAKRMIVGHEKVGDPWEEVIHVNAGPLGSEDIPVDLVRTAFFNIRRQYQSATTSDTEVFDTAVAFDRLGNDEWRDRYLLKILLSGDKPWPERPGNSLEDLRLSVKGWRLGRAVAGKDRNLIPPEPSLATRQQVAMWLRVHLTHPLGRPVSLLP